jgi:hypothetical protein
MNPPEYNTVANELLPRLMFKLGKFLTYDNGELAQLCQKLDDVEKYKSAADDAMMKQLFTGTMRQLVSDAYDMVDRQHAQKSVNDIIKEHNANIRMPTNALNMLLSHIWEDLQIANLSSDIVTSASECITCSRKEYDVIKKSVATWLSSNKEHYVILF